MKNKRQLIIQGSAKGMAEYIFETVITPAYSHLHAVHEVEADNFSFCMAGITVAGYLAASHNLDADKAKLLNYIEAMYEDIQNENNGLKFLIKPAGKPS